MGNLIDTRKPGTVDYISGAVENEEFAAKCLGG